MAGTHPLSPWGGALGLAARRQGSSHCCQPGREHSGRRLLSASWPHTQSQGLGGWDLGGCPWNPKAQGTHRLFTGPTVLLGHVLAHLVAAACKQHGTGRGLSFPFRLISFRWDALARCLFNPGCDVCFHWFPFTG